MEKLKILVPTSNLTLLTLTLFLFLSTIANAEVEYSIPLHGKEFKMGNRIEWKTAYELNTKMFILEKSDDGINFYLEREIEAAGNSNEEKGYRFMDIGNNEAITYYRLKLVDEDDRESYSQIAMVNKKMANNFQIVSMSKTSVINKFEVTLDALVEKEMSYTLTKLNGEEIFSKKIVLINGLNEFEINMKDEQVGKYKIIFRVEDESEMLIIRKIDGEEKQENNVASKN